jgi:hypothetical protein
MPWQGLGGTLNPGQTVRWWYTWGGYHGVEVARARPLNPGSELIVRDPGQRLETGNGYTYFVSVSNVGPFPVNYNLTGGTVN